MSIGDKPINAIFTENGYCREASILAKGLASGLTYREWLIGQLACNVGAIVRSEGFENDIADGLIRQADAIIKQLDEESE